MYRLFSLETAWQVVPFPAGGGAEAIQLVPSLCRWQHTWKSQWSLQMTMCPVMQVVR